MLWIDAPRGIAVMQHAEAVWDRPMMQLPRQTVGVDVFVRSITPPDNSVALRVGASEDPTAVRLLYFVPESIREWARCVRAVAGLAATLPVTASDFTRRRAKQFSAGASHVHLLWARGVVALGAAICRGRLTGIDLKSRRTLFTDTGDVRLWWTARLHVCFQQKGW